MLIFHVAEQRAWEAAKTAGAYAISTRGRTLEEEGFIHASREDQVDGILDRYYADHPGPLVLLVIETDRLTATWRDEAVGDAVYPHIFGAINPSAVVEVRPIPRAGTATDAAAEPTEPARTFMQVWLAEFAFRIAAGVFVMAMAVGAGVATSVFIKDEAGVVGMIAGAALAVAIVVPVARRRRQS